MLFAFFKCLFEAKNTLFIYFCTMKRFCYILLALLFVLHSEAQLPARQSEVCIFIEDSLWNMTPSTTISELTRGWEIQGFVVGRKIRRYLYGSRSKQSAPSSCPAFVIRPAEGSTLTDYALIRLTPKKNYRRFTSGLLSECLYRRADLHEFQIEPYGEDAFRVQPNEKLKTGEYVWVCLSQKPTNEFGDVIVYDFSIR